MFRARIRGRAKQGEQRARDAPYPGGPEEITHVYSDATTNTVEVSSTWQAAWSIGEYAGTVPGLAVDNTIDLDVREVQAVRQR